MPGWDPQGQPGQAGLPPKQVMEVRGISELETEPLHEGHSSAHSQAFVPRTRRMEAGSWEPGDGLASPAAGRGCGAARLRVPHPTTARKGSGAFYN